jgi:hypothetical protein
MTTRIHVLIVLFATFVVTVGCSLDKAKKIELYGDDLLLTKKEMLIKIPKNSSITDAKQIMEYNSFVCKKFYNSSFGKEENIDFLYCDKKVWEKLFVERRYQIAITHKNEQVTDILISTGLTGF